MQKLTTLANEPKQKMTISIDNIRIDLFFQYKINQLGWFFGFEYDGNSYQNIRLTTSYNILRAYKNWLPFGIACNTIDGLEPIGIDDFISNYATVYILNKDEVNTIESTYYVKKT